MNLVSDLDLPAFDTAPDFSADRYHQQLAETGQLGWLARSPLAVAAGRGRGHSRDRQAPDHLVGSGVSPNHGPVPDV
jgi:hypothetical protein